MRLWQAAMIRLARSPRLGTLVQSRASFSSLAKRFVGGSTLPEALESVRRLRTSGIRASLFFLGEYVSDTIEVEGAVEAKKAAAAALGEEGLDVHVSVDPTQIGHLLSRETMRDNAYAIGRTVEAAMDRKAEPGVDVLMLDMEDEDLVDDTIALYRELRDRGVPAALTLQAYLRRTAADLPPLIRAGGMVRLVKGAFAADHAIAFTTRSQIRRSFLRLARVMLSEDARAAGFYPSFATHDETLIEEVERLAGSNGWERESYEYEMLHGVRPDLQRDLARRSRVRAYVPFGEAWWPYAARRVGESPWNALFLIRAITSGLVSGSRA